MGDLRCVQPISEAWGDDRGLPIDRYYIERFLATHREDIKGRVLEVSNNAYTHKFGSSAVSQSDVLHVARREPPVTIVADLTTGEGLPSAAFDCLILTQTLQCIYDLSAAVRTLARILKPGGVALVTVPGISKICRYDMERWGHYWGFTTRSARRLFEQTFLPSSVQVEAHGNVLAATAFLHGLATKELRPSELEYRDAEYELLITVRVQKPRTLASDVESDLASAAARED